MKRVVVFFLAAFSALSEETTVEPISASIPPTPPPTIPGLPVSLPTPPAPSQTAPSAWLGLQVTKPDLSTTTQLPALPPGIGFIIQSINADGPAARAGLQEYDILWKIGDQMLVNEGQMAALLRLSKPGDDISLSAFRGGKPIEITAKLGEVPATHKELPEEWVDSTLLPGECGGPMRVVNLAEKVAIYSNEEGQAEVRREGEAHYVKITGPDDAVIHEGPLASPEDQEKIPEAWKRRVFALRRGLDHAIDNRLMPLRQPRPRVVPPP
jgi:hypothetical protein